MGLIFWEEGVVTLLFDIETSSQFIYLPVEGSWNFLIDLNGLICLVWNTTFSRECQRQICTDKIDLDGLICLAWNTTFSRECLRQICRWNTLRLKRNEGDQCKFIRLISSSEVPHTHTYCSLFLRVHHFHRKLLEKLNGSQKVGQNTLLYYMGIILHAYGPKLWKQPILIWTYFKVVEDLG